MMGEDVRNSETHGSSIKSILIFWICTCLCLLLTSAGRAAALQDAAYPHDAPDHRTKFALTESALLASSSERTSNAIPEAEEDTISALAKYGAKKYDSVAGSAAVAAVPEPQLEKPYPYHKSRAAAAAALQPVKLETHPEYPVHESKRAEETMSGSVALEAAAAASASSGRMSESVGEVAEAEEDAASETAGAAETESPSGSTSGVDSTTTGGEFITTTGAPVVESTSSNAQEEVQTDSTTKDYTATVDERRTTTPPAEVAVTESADSATVGETSTKNTQSTVESPTSTESIALSTELETERFFSKMSTEPPTSTPVTTFTTSESEKFTTTNQDGLTDKNLISTALQEEPSTINEEEASTLTPLTTETTINVPVTSSSKTGTTSLLQTASMIPTTMLPASTIQEATLASTPPTTAGATTLAAQTALTTTEMPAMLATTTEIIPTTLETAVMPRTATTAETVTAATTQSEIEQKSTTESPTMATTKSPPGEATTTKPAASIETTSSETIDAVTSQENQGTTTNVDSSTPKTEDVTFLIKIVFEGSWKDICSRLTALRKSLATLINSNVEKPISPKQVIFHQSQCSGNVMPTISTSEETLTAVLIYIVDDNGNFDETLTKMLPSLYQMNPIDFPLTIHSFMPVLETETGNALIIIIVSCVVFICLVLIAVILIIMRKRQGRFNYGERCRPVSLDAYSLDSVSAYNSVRRNKGALRASKRSYGNPTFEDSSAVPSHPLNFNGLSIFVNDTNAINEEFGNIPQVASKIDELPPGAELKNRYANVIPLPETRVPLQILNSDPHSEYINASYVRGPKNANKYYIACQAPTETTVSDFWRMIWEQQSKVIIMLTDLVENGVEKCTEYIPPLEVSDCHRLFGDYQVTLKKREAKDKYAISTVQLKNLENNTFREVSHIWYLWPTNGCPTDGTALISVLLEARALQRGAAGPIVIHCSPGTGRTGTLIALDLGIRQYEITRTIDVPRVVYTIRRDRAGAVQTKDQYAFIYKALNLYASKLAGGALESV